MGRVMDRKEIRGYLYILAGTTLWGVSSVVAKSLFQLGLPPAQLVFIRLTLSTLILLLIFLVSDRNSMVIDRKDIPYFIILGLIGVAGNQFAYYYTISKIHVGPGILIQYLCVFWIALYAFFFQKEPFSRWKIFSLWLALAGCYFAVGAYRMDLLRLNQIGILSGLAASFFFSFYTLYGEKGLRRYRPWTLVFYSFIFGAVFYSLLIFPLRVLTAGYSLSIWAAFFYVAIVQTLIPFGLYFKGIDRIRATRASITSTWEVITSGITAYFVLGEVLYPLQILGGIAVIGAIVLLQIEREKGGPSSAFAIRQKKEEAFQTLELMTKVQNLHGIGED
jgi:drug/metabolite transporter (DMT)-like permease